MAKFNFCFIEASLRVRLYHMQNFFGYLYPTGESQKLGVLKKRPLKTVHSFFANCIKIFGNKRKKETQSLLKMPALLHQNDNYFSLNQTSTFYRHLVWSHWNALKIPKPQFIEFWCLSFSYVVYSTKYLFIVLASDACVLIRHMDIQLFGTFDDDLKKFLNSKILKNF